jgi:HRAS-like suppressor 3
MMASYTSPVRTDSLEPGTELIVDRLAYRHHGIYVGGGLVIHYAGWISYRHGLVEAIPLGNFAGKHPIRVGRVPTESLHGEDIVRRARSRLGERCYDVLKNNCEHFLQLVSSWGEPEHASRPALATNAAGDARRA